VLLEIAGSEIAADAGQHLAHRADVKLKQKGRLSAAPCNACAALFVQAAACAFRFLRQPSRPKPPRPVAKSGRAAGSEVVAVPVKPGLVGLLG
jgi:hypothetical protein